MYSEWGIQSYVFINKQPICQSKTKKKKRKEEREKRLLFNGPLSPIRCVTVNPWGYSTSFPFLYSSSVSTPRWCFYSAAFPVLYSTVARWIRDNGSTMATRNMDGSCAEASGWRLRGAFQMAAVRWIRSYIGWKPVFIDVPFPSQRCSAIIPIGVPLCFRSSFWDEVSGMGNVGSFPVPCD
jgi:hypothetical protein